MTTREIDCTQLRMLVEGIELARRAKRYRRPSNATMQNTPWRSI